MKNYSVPPNMNEKEKVIGGVLDFTQFFWLIGGLLVGAVAFVILFPLLNKFALIFGIIFGLTGVPFALFKKEGLSLFEYYKRKRRFDKKTKHLPNKRNLE